MGKQGFAALSPEKRKEMARKGGLSRRTKTGFALMSPERLREVSSRGGRSRGTR